MLQPERREYLWASLIYALMVMVFFHPVLFGLIISQTDFLFSISPWDSVRPTDLTAIANPYLQDQSNEFLPFFLEAKRQLVEGLFPLWNPYIFTGTPLWANTQSALLFPLNWFHYLLAPPLGFTISAILKLFIGSLSSYHLSRVLNMSHVAGLVTGTAFGFCAFSVFWLNHPHVNVIILLPLCFALAEQWVRNPGIKRAVMYSGLLGLMILAGHVEIAFLGAFGCGLFVLIRLWQSEQLGLKPLWQLLFIHLGSLGFAAILVLPFVEFLMHTAVWSERGDNFIDAIPMAGWPSLFLPDLFFGKGWDVNNTGFHAFSPFFGFTALTLMVLGVLAKQRLALPFIVLFVVAFMTAFSIPPVYQAINLLPLFSHTPLFYFSVLMVLAGTQLAGLGWDALSSLRGKPHTALIWFLSMFVLILVIDFWWEASMLSEFAKSVTELTAHVNNGVNQLWFWGIALTVVFWFAVRFNQVGVVLVLGLLFFELWRSGHDWNPTIEAEHGYPTTTPGSIQFLNEQTGLFRIVAFDRILKPSTNMLDRLSDVRGYDVPVFDRYHNHFNQLLGGKDAFWYYDLPKFDPGMMPFLSDLNVRFLLSKQALPDDLGLVLVYDEEIKIYENTQVKDRAYLNTNTVHVESAEAAIEMMQELNQQLSDQVVLESAPKATPGALEVTGKVHVAAWQADQITLGVDNPKDAWLVLSQSVYPGWKATIDGESAEIVPANHLSQAIHVDAGSHVVKFKYRPWSFYWGVVISVFSVLFLIWVMRRKTKS